MKKWLLAQTAYKELADPLMNRILIDIPTIRRNHRAGATVTHQSMGCRVDLTFCAYGDDKRIWEHRYVATGLHAKVADVLESAIDRPELLVDCLINGKEVSRQRTDKWRVFSLEEDYQLEQLHHLPEREYFFDYKPTNVKCSACGEWCLHTEIDEGEDGDSYSSEVCPSCGVWDSFDLKCETIAEARRREEAIA